MRQLIPSRSIRIKGTRSVSILGTEHFELSNNVLEIRGKLCVFYFGPIVDPKRRRTVMINRDGMFRKNVLKIFSWNCAIIFDWRSNRANSLPDINWRYICPNWMSSNCLRRILKGYIFISCYISFKSRPQYNGFRFALWRTLSHFCEKI